MDENDFARLAAWAEYRRQREALAGVPVNDDDEDPTIDAKPGDAENVTRKACDLQGGTHMLIIQDKQDG